jgi:hypothetical protein
VRRGPRTGGRTQEAPGLGTGAKLIPSGKRRKRRVWRAGLEASSNGPDCSRSALRGGGPQGALDGELAERLKLTPPAQGQIAELIREQSEQLAGRSREAASSIRAETNRQSGGHAQPRAERGPADSRVGALEAPDRGRGPVACTRGTSEEPVTPPKSIEPKATETQAAEVKPSDVKLRNPSRQNPSRPRRSRRNPSPPKSSMGAN